ncbi:NAD(P)H-dependent oxidoreductase [Bowmanella sp. Y26]|uniref:FMN-dependent NADH-azoreductase n=1 Tax=Bowmanella yangjiangensis TaxID=2811230 RepID=UPI001BDC35CD|nr:NAD(P)H-dependent oxidoreductase [Bowmanella yangjiangensis]MBT1065423.1 NAD(P)H-dependent oxidoreductase [Bowmanella yangjiangensis]
MRILRIDASVRGDTNERHSYRSISRQLGNAFIERLEMNKFHYEIKLRDVGKTPPAFIDENWLAACFTPEEKRTTEQKQVLALSDELFDELVWADTLVMTTPMYNYGMPAALKAWFDQVSRVNKTFSFDLARGDFPIAPLLSGKRLILLSSTGEFGFEAGGVREQMNHLAPHVRTLCHYLGVEQIDEVQVQYQEFADHRHEASMQRGFAEVQAIADRLNNDAVEQQESACA